MTQTGQDKIAHGKTKKSKRQPNPTRQGKHTRQRNTKRDDHKTNKKRRTQDKSKPEKKRQYSTRYIRGGKTKPSKPTKEKTKKSTYRGEEKDKTNTK